MQLMELTESLRRLDDVVDAAVVMATEANKETLRSLGLLTQEGMAAGPNDLLIAVRVRKDLDRVIEESRRLIFRGVETRMKKLSLDEALKEDVDFASISIPGRYVEDVATKLIERGVHLFIFSDRVPLDVEVSLKKRARERGVLVMGPEAGTAIVGGVGFGFANKVRKGTVGLVASAGTGIQEFTTLLDWMGIGTSHAIGVGGRDMTKEVGGIMTAEALNILMKDDDTRVIAVIAKQSDEETVRRLLESVKATKPVFTALLGSRREYVGQYPNSQTIHNLSLKVCMATSAERFKSQTTLLREEVSVLKRLVGGGGGYPRGFYSGGTLATETAYIWSWLGFKVSTNMTLPWTSRLSNTLRSEGATIVDYGDEEFTEGRPHPIIDPSMRNMRVSSELRSEETSAIVMDLITGYGVPDNIVAKTVEQVRDVVNTQHTKRLAIHVVGTTSDPQWNTTGLLESLPITRASSNALAAAFVAAYSLGDVDVIDRVLDSLVLGGLD